MYEREKYDATQEALREVAGRADRSTRERIWAGLMNYLTAEAHRARKRTESEVKDRRSR